MGLQVWVSRRRRHCHQNIVSYLGRGRHEGQLFYAMEYVPGGTLKQILARDGRLRWKEAAECGRQIAAALQHAHNHGIIHRDLKPGNIFVDDQGRLKLGDFGIARDLHAADITDSGLTVGTYSYMAPELVRGERSITGQVDLYGLGCVLFEIVAGRPPYLGDNFAQIFDQHLNAPIPRLRDHGVQCPPEFGDVITALLAKQPGDRPFNARTVQGKLGEMTFHDEIDVSQMSDRAARSVSGQELLRRRVATISNPMHLSWAKLLLAGAAVVVAIGTLAYFAR
ncbi:serine/threonine-protein kinase [Planctomycetota bacterium]